MSCIDHGRSFSLRPEGYAMVGIPGVSSRCTGLHRLVYAQKIGVALDAIRGIIVRHTCDNPRCINPEHLLGGTRGDNNRDRAARGRSAKSVPSRQRLTQDDVLAIKQRWVKSTAPKHNPNGTTAIALDYGVDRAVITRVINGKYLCHS